MPHFYFDVHHGPLTEVDKHGANLGSAGVAREQALRKIRALVVRDAAKGLLWLRRKMVIRDPQGNTLQQIGFEEAFDIDLPHDRGGSSGFGYTSG